MLANIGLVDKRKCGSRVVVLRRDDSVRRGFADLLKCVFLVSASGT